MFYYLFGTYVLLVCFFKVSYNDNTKENRINKNKKHLRFLGEIVSIIHHDEPKKRKRKRNQ